jgi:hypothetical protein
MSATAKTSRGRLAVAACLACVLALAAAWAPAAKAANVAGPIRAVFLKEFSRTEYFMVQGQLLIFQNSDPFLAHGIGGALLASTAAPGKDRLVRNSPYLGPGSYGFFDPLYPEMRSTLTVLPGTPLPPDTTAPTAKFKMLKVSPRKLASTGRVRVRMTPSEAVDVDLSLRIGKKKVAATTAAFADPVTRTISMLIAESDRDRLAKADEIAVKGRITDVTGKVAKVRADRKLGKKKGKKRKK